MADLLVTNHGSLFTLTPQTEGGQNWLDEYVIGDETMLWAGGVVVEPRYIENIVDGAINDGLSVE